MSFHATDLVCMRNLPLRLQHYAPQDRVIHCHTSIAQYYSAPTNRVFHPAFVYSKNFGTLVAHWCASGYVVVPDMQSGGCRFESRAGLLHTKVYSAVHPSAVGKMSTSCGWEGKGRYSSFHLRMKHRVSR